MTAFDNWYINEYHYRIPFDQYKTTEFVDGLADTKKT